MSNQNLIYSGVIEGFYGRPWSQEQRFMMLQWLVDFGLNTYFYAPKDDLKQRAFWRESYDAQELAALEKLVSQSKACGVRFLVGLSPGLDIRFADEGDRQLVLQRISQLQDIGVDGVALLFDDLPGELTAGDAKAFGSLARAQSSIANEVYQWLEQRQQSPTLLFCPTPYCERMEQKQLGGTHYLEDLGESLHPSIDIFWTGPEIISPAIPRVSIEQVSRKLQRPPVVWDNLHANDYDGRRLFCGPYNRENDLKSVVRGILLNPNNEFPINYIPLRTLGQYLHETDYDPHQAYLDGLRCWVGNYALFRCREETSAISIEDLRILCDCFYLPHELGEEAEKLKRCVEILLHKELAEWHDCLEDFRNFHQRVVHVFEMLTELRDRELFYAWSRKIWELREEMDLLGQIVDAKQAGNFDPKRFTSPTHLPGTYRGGVVAQLQRHLQVNEHISIMPS